MSHTEIRTIFFDIGNVLVGFDHELIWKRLSAFSKFPPAEIRQRIRETRVMDLHETGKLPAEDFFHELRKLGELDTELSYEEFCLIWGDIFWENKAVIQLACALQKQYAVYLLSNVGDIHWDWLTKRYPIFTNAPDAILSFRVGSMKPDHAIYQEAIRRSGNTAAQCVYIDDVPAYIAASRELGIHGIQYHTPSQLYTELHRLNIAC